MSKPFLIIGACLAMTSVVIGAFAAHALKPHLSEYALAIIKTGVQYQMFHSIAVIACGLLILQFTPTEKTAVWLARAAMSFIFGVLLFSGSLYGLALTTAKWLGPVTPIGGTLMITGWLMFIYAAFNIKDSIN